MEKPEKFEKIGGAYVGYAVAIKSQTGAEIIVLCPTKEEAIVAAETWGSVDIDPRHIQRASLSPVSNFAAKQSAPK